MKLLSKKDFFNNLRAESGFDINEFARPQGELILKQKENIRYLDFKLNGFDQARFGIYEQKEKTLLEWLLNILKVAVTSEICFHSLEDKWIIGKTADIWLNRAKELLAEHGIRNNFAGAACFSLDEKHAAKIFLEVFSINSFRGYSNVLIWAKYAHMDLIISPCDHFDYHIYPSDLKMLEDIAVRFLPSPDFEMLKNSASL